jgi:8-oxo-dGTP pyrophosphatase MutT (NUDIX family)
MSSRHAPVLSRLREALRRHSRRALSIDGFRAAAVLVPIVERDADLALLLTERTADLRAHAGQIAFPGGKLDAADADLAACAIREAAEELGLEPAAIEVLGQLDDVPTPSGFVITPVVAAVRGAPHVRPNPGEVAGFFYAPLAALADPAIMVRKGERELLGVRYPIFGYQYDARLIWGATACMVQQLLALLAAETPERSDTGGS